MTINIINTVKPKLLERAFKEIGFDKLERIIKGALEREAHKLTGAELKEIKDLQRQASKFWKKAVVVKAGKQCEAVDAKGKRCNKVKHLQAHHIESFALNKFLRYSLHNGIGLCPTHHKFGRLSAHKSFCMMFNLMTQKRKDDLDYLLEHYKDKTELTKEFLLEKIRELSK